MTALAAQNRRRGRGTVKRTRGITVKLTPEEHAQASSAAGALSVGAWAAGVLSEAAGTPEAGPQWRVHGNAAGDGDYAVSQLTPDRGLIPVITGLERWQALAIVAILHHPHGD